MIASVSDDPYDLRTCVVVRRPKAGHAYVGTNLAPVASSVSDAEYCASISGAPTRGLNERGLAFTWALALEKAENQAPPQALKPHELWHEVMTRCTTVDEALELLEQLPRGVAAASMIADRGGNLVLVEFGRKRITVSQRLSRESGGTAVNVNCWMAMQAAEGDPLCTVENSSVPNGSRYRRAQMLLERADGEIGVSTLAGILRDHEHRDRHAGENAWIPGHGFSICNHGSLRESRFDPCAPAWGSVSAEIIEPASGVFWYAHGWPCGEAPRYGDEKNQENSWGVFVGFPLAHLEEGVYTTLLGGLTPLAARHLRHLSTLERSSPPGKRTDRRVSMLDGS